MAIVTKESLEKWIAEMESQTHLSLKEERYLIVMKELSELRLAPVMPEEAHPAAIYAIWAHRYDQRGMSENKLSAISYKRLRQYLLGTAQPQSEWERPSKYGFK